MLSLRSIFALLDYTGFELGVDFLKMMPHQNVWIQGKSPIENPDVVINIQAKSLLEITRIKRIEILLM
jgi:hypothetical protein